MQQLIKFQIVYSSRNWCDIAKGTIPRSQRPLLNGKHFSSINLIGLVSFINRMENVVMKVIKASPNLILFSSDLDIKNDNKLI